MDPQGRPMLSTGQAASRLGVKPETLYAYVSRGLLTSARGADGRSSVFDPAEIDRLIGRPRRGGAPRASAPTVQSRLTDVREGRLRYRGRDATTLCAEPFEAVARWLWTGVLDRREFTAPAALVAVASQITAAMPASARTVDRVRAILPALAAADPLGADLRTDAVAATAAALLAAVVDGLPDRSSSTPAASPRGPAIADDPTLAGGRHRSGSTATGGTATGGTTAGGSASGSTAAPLAHRLWPKLTAVAASPGGVDALNTALVLLADHDVAASTLAARVAASARGHPYAVVAAGLAALDAQLHSGVSAPVHRALVDAERDGTGAVLTRLLADGRRLPGFGHPSYPDGDPRGGALLARLADAPLDRVRWSQVTEFLAASARGAPVPPNVDFALAALSYTAGMDADAGDAVLALARTAGWIAHAIEEYAEEPLRFQPTTVYVGPP